MTCCYIGLGSNLEVPQQQLRRALESLSAISALPLKVSGFYRSSPMGPTDQPDYINAVACLDTSVEPQLLLKQLHQIEAGQGRVRSGPRWGARTLDLDILIYDDRIIDTPELQIPHPGLAQRNFVLYPLLELAPDLQVPGLGSVSELIAGCELGDLVKL